MVSLFPSLTSNWLPPVTQKTPPGVVEAGVGRDEAVIRARRGGSGAGDDGEGLIRNVGDVADDADNVVLGIGDPKVVELIHGDRCRAAEGVVLVVETPPMMKLVT